MKYTIEKFKTQAVQAFTLIEMLIVLLVISVLMLLFVPNLSKQKEAVSDKGNAAVVKVVESQAELYELNNPSEKATVSKLQSEGKITESQAKAYRSHYEKNKSETPNVAS